MRIKILLIGNDPAALVPDGQLLRDHNILVFTAFNLQNIPELITEVKPDILFFDAQSQNDAVTQAYNDIVNSESFRNIPVIFALTEDDLYLVTRKRNDIHTHKNLVADNIIGAIKMAMSAGKIHSKHNHAGRELKLQAPAIQLQLPIYFR